MMLCDGHYEEEKWQPLVVVVAIIFNDASKSHLWSVAEFVQHWAFNQR